MRKFLYLMALIISLLPFCVYADDGFDYPVGKPNGDNYYDAQGFGEWNSRFSGYHLGEDWNKRCGGDCDLGDPLSSVSTGTVVLRKNLEVWGNIVVVRHELGSGVLIDSMYAHLKDVHVNEGDLVTRGKLVGTVGKGQNNIFPAHLHFEVRDSLGIGAGTGYGAFKPKGWQEPTAFINSHRPVPAPPPVANPVVTATNNNGANTITWDKAGEGFDRYEVFRDGVLLGKITDQNQLSFEDKNISGGNTYKYKVLAIYKNGQVGTSTEVDIEVKREVKRITPSGWEDRNPFVYAGKVFYQSIPQRTSPSDLPLLYYYDIATGETKSVTLSGCGKYPYSPTANGNLVAYYANTNSYSREDICYYNSSTDTTVPVSFDPLLREQIYPVISDDGKIFWQDLGNGTNWDIYFLDTKKSSGPEPFVVAPKDQRYPRVWGNKLVWKDSRNYVGSNDYDLYVKDIGGSAEIKIATGLGLSPFDIWDKYVVWEYKGKLSMYNLEARETTVVNGSGVNYFPAVRDGKVAYTAKENGKSWIHIYDIATARDTKLDIEITGQPVLSVWENYLAFELSTKKETGVSDFDVYLMKF